MQNGIDMDAATDFAVCISHLIFARWPNRGLPNPRPLMVTCAAVGDEHGFEQASRETRMDIACLAFSPGREREGPVNVSLIEERNGVLTTWPRCSPWTHSSEGPCLLLAEGRDVGFAYDGARLLIVRDVPNEQKAERIAMAQETLRLMTRCMPDDLRMAKSLVVPTPVGPENRRAGPRPPGRRSVRRAERWRHGMPKR